MFVLSSGLGCHNELHYVNNSSICKSKIRAYLKNPRLTLYLIISNYLCSAFQELQKGASTGYAIMHAYYMVVYIATFSGTTAVALVALQSSEQSDSEIPFRGVN